MYTKYCTQGKATWSTLWLASSRLYLCLAEKLQIYASLGLLKLGCIYSSRQCYLQVAKIEPTKGLSSQVRKLLLANSPLSSWVLTECAVPAVKISFTPQKADFAVCLCVVDSPLALWPCFSFHIKGLNGGINRYSGSQE